MSECRPNKLASKQPYFHISMIRACKAQFCSAIFVLSLSDTNTSQSIYGFRQTKLFENLSYLTIEIYNKANDTILLSQNSLNSTHGYFQYFTSSWQNGIGPNLIGLRRRFVCTSALPQVDINIRIFKGR